jgi:sulfur transfer complex TusBCD TusB component (DsrH family)
MKNSSYQINIPVRLSEEDRCLYSRLGLGYFNVRNIADDGQINPYFLPFHAVITSIDIDKCDCTKVIFHIFVKLTNTADSTFRQNGAVFVITAGNSIGCHSARILTTINVAPFSDDIIARGIFNQCTSFEMIRVPSREVVPISPETQGVVADPSANSNSIIGGNAIAITFPLNHELKCLAPTHLIIAGPTAGVKTKVRVVSCGPVKFSIPALLAYDFTACTVTLEIDLGYIADSYQSDALTGYEQLFAPCRDGFNNVQDDTQSGTIELISIINQYFGSSITPPNPGEASARFFQLLSASRKLDLMGVDKCANKVLHTFTICYVPWADFLVPVNCVLRSTQPLPSVDKDTDTGIGIGIRANDNTFKNGYTVMSECEYSYKYYNSQYVIIVSPCPDKPGDKLS